MRAVLSVLFRFSLCTFIGLYLLSCSKKTSGTSANLPNVTPPVEAATPAGLKSSRGLRTISSSDIKSRFFTSGPTNIFSILQSIDDRINGINSQSTTISPSPACLTQSPVAYTVTPWGQSITMYGQCYENVSGSNSLPTDPLLVQWGVKDGITYLYTAVGAERAAVIATPITGQSGQYTIQAWLGVGYSNSQCGSGEWDTCSYGVMQLTANSYTKSFEMAVAGLGFGYCGAQLKSDGTNLYMTGSVDMGSSCNAIDTACVAASDATTAGTCDSSLTTFSISALGRELATGSGAGTATTWAASLYPASPTVVLNGTTSDDLYFGPTSPSTGVGKFQ